MKTVIQMIAVSFITAVFVMTISSQLQEPARNELDQGDLSSRMASNEATLQNLMDDLNSDPRDARRAAPSPATALAVLRADIESIKLELAALRAGSRVSVNKDGPEVTTLVDDRVALAVQAMRQIEQEEKNNTARRKALRSAKKKATRFRRKLELNDDQTEQLAQALAQQDEVNYPLYRDVKSEEATTEERLITLQQLRQNRTTFLQGASNFLTPDQTANFEEMYTQSNQWIDEWINRLQNPGQPSRGK